MFWDVCISFFSDKMYLARWTSSQRLLGWWVVTPLTHVGFYLRCFTGLRECFLIREIFIRDSELLPQLVCSTFFLCPNQYSWYLSCYSEEPLLLQTGFHQPPHTCSENPCNEPVGKLILSGYVVSSQNFSHNQYQSSLYIRMNISAKKHFGLWRHHILWVISWN